jgi:hypothetical protein
MLFVNIGKYRYMLQTYCVLYGFMHDDTLPVFNLKWALENLSLAEKLLSGGCRIQVRVIWMHDVPIVLVWNT